VSDTSKYVLLKAKVMVEQEGQPFELEVTGVDGTKHRVQPSLENVYAPCGDLRGLASQERKEGT